MARRRKQRMMRLQFPLGGVDRNWSPQQQPPFTTPDALNVRGRETIEGRARGGQRPGLSNLFMLGPIYPAPGPVNLLNQVTAAGSDAGAYFAWSDDFRRTGDDVGGGWTQASWADDNVPVMLEADDLDHYVGAGAAVAPDLDFSIDNPYTVEIRIVPHEGTHAATYDLYFGLDNTTPDYDDRGVRVRLSLDGASYSGSITEISDGVEVGSSSIVEGTGTETDGWFAVRVDDTSVTVRWQGAEIALYTFQDRTTAKRLGFGCSVADDALYPPTVALADIFQVSGTAEGVSHALNRRTYLVAGGDGDIYAEQDIGQLTKVSGAAAHIRSDKLVHSAERGQKLYIADYGNARVDGTGTVDADGTTFEDGDVADWTALDIDTDVDTVTITGGTGDVVDGNYAIDSLAEGELTLASSAGGAGTCNYEIGRAPKVYDPVEDTMSLWVADTGVMPYGCPLVCVYRDRLVLAGEPQHAWYMSRQGDPTDWDYAADVDDAQRPVSGANSDAGQVGDIITALAPYSDDYLVFGCRGSIWILIGDPAFNGQIDNVSYELGFLSQSAWCHGAHGEIYFLSDEGLFRLIPGSSSRVEPLSPETVPAALKGIDASETRAILAWNTDERGVHIFLTSEGDEADTEAWFYDTQFGAFWPDRYHADHGPTAVHNYRTDIKGYQGLLLGGRDGILRKVSPTAWTDTGEVIDSHVIYGPVNISGDNYTEGLIQRLTAALSEDSGDVAWEIRVADTLERCVAATAQRSGEWSGEGQQPWSYCRVRGGGGCLRLSSAESGKASTAWSIEKVLMGVVQGGRHR